MGASCSNDSGEAEAQMNAMSGPWLIDHAAWVEQSADGDPLSSHRPANISCDKGTGWMPEDNTLEVNTESCNFSQILTKLYIPVYFRILV